MTKPHKINSFQSKRWLFGWLVRLNYDSEGWFITDNKGYRNTLPMAYMVITDATGQTIRRVTAGPIMLEWAYPQNNQGGEP